MSDMPDTLEDLGIDEAAVEERDELYEAAVAAADAPPEPVSPEAAAPVAEAELKPAPAAEVKPLVMTLVFEGPSVTITAKRGNVGIIGKKYAVHDEQAVLLAVIEDVQAKLAALEASGIPDIKFPEPPKPEPKPAASKPAAKPAEKSTAKKPAASKPDTAKKEKPAAAPKPVPEIVLPVPPAPPPEISTHQLETMLFNKMVHLPEPDNKRMGSVLGWANMLERTVEVLTNKGVEIFPATALTVVITKSKK